MLVKHFHLWDYNELTIFLPTVPYTKYTDIQLYILVVRYAVAIGVGGWRVEMVVGGAAGKLGVAAAAPSVAVL